MVTALPTKSIPLLTLEGSFFLYSRATLSRKKNDPSRVRKGDTHGIQKIQNLEQSSRFCIFCNSSSDRSSRGVTIHNTKRGVLSVYQLFYFDAKDNYFLRLLLYVGGKIAYFLLKW